MATQADVNPDLQQSGGTIPATQADVDAGLARRQPICGILGILDPTSEGCAEAVYNSKTGAVEWNMGEGFMLQEGYTYQVRFKVWPSQEAYDLLADLNNGKKSICFPD